MTKTVMFFLLFFSLLLVSCAVPPSVSSVPSKAPTASLPDTSNPLSSPTVVPNGVTQKQVVFSGYEIINNCGGTGQVQAVIERSKTIRHEVELGAEVKVEASGEAKILGTGVNVGVAVAGKYGTTYGTEERFVRSLNITTKEHSKVRYDYEMAEVWELGKLRFSNQDQEIPYRFRQGFSLELVDTKELSCDTSMPTSPSLTSSPKVTALPGSPQPPSLPTKAPPSVDPTQIIKSESPWFGMISFCVQIDANNRCVSPTSSLPTGTRKFYISWEYKGIPLGAVFERRWYRDGQMFRQVNDVWGNGWNSPTGVEYTFLDNGVAFPLAEYRVELYINGVLLQTAKARIGR